MVDGWRSYQKKGFAGACSVDGSRTLIDLKLGVTNYVEAKRHDPVKIWLFICYLALGPLNLVFVCINFATRPAWGRPSSNSPGDWGVMQLQHILDIFEFSLLMAVLALIAWTVARYALRHVVRCSGGDQVPLPRTMLLLYDRWSDLQLSALSGLELLSIRADVDRGALQCAQWVLGRHRAWHSSKAATAVVFIFALALYTLLACLSMASLLLKVCNNDC